MGTVNQPASVPGGTSISGRPHGGNWYVSMPSGGAVGPMTPAFAAGEGAGRGQEAAPPEPGVDLAPGIIARAGANGGEAELRGAHAIFTAYNKREVLSSTLRTSGR